MPLRGDIRLPVEEGNLMGSKDLGGGAATTHAARHVSMPDATTRRGFMMRDDRKAQAGALVVVFCTFFSVDGLAGYVHMRHDKRVSDRVGRALMLLFKCAESPISH